MVFFFSKGDSWVFSIAKKCLFTVFKSQVEIFTIVAKNSFQGQYIIRWLFNWLKQVEHVQIKFNVTKKIYVPKVLNTYTKDKKKITFRQKEYVWTT